MKKYYHPLGLPGIGDLGHPDEWDDGTCKTCGFENCTKECTCRYCATTCAYCGYKTPVEKDNPEYVTSEGDPCCEGCWNDTFKDYWEEFDRNHQE